MNIENLRIQTYETASKGLPTISENSFQSFLFLVDSARKNQEKIKKKSQEQQEPTPSTSKAINTSASTTESNKDDSVDFLKNKIDSEQKEFSSNDQAQNKIELSSLKQAIGNLSVRTCQNFALELMKVIEILTISHNNHISCSQKEFKVTFSGEETKDIRILPEVDQTNEQGDITYVEGILPLQTSRYKFAVNKKLGKNDDPIQADLALEKLLLNNIIHNCFPTHWVRDVTCRGHGGRQSLVTIWNNQYPLKNPCEGLQQMGLGESRLQALIGMFKFLFNLQFSNFFHFLEFRSCCEKSSKSFLR